MLSISFVCHVDLLLPAPMSVPVDGVRTSAVAPTSSSSLLHPVADSSFAALPSRFDYRVFNGFPNAISPASSVTGSNTGFVLRDLAFNMDLSPL
ncbi:hypothetical protein B0H11DRAFT_2273749 [Mycena galericulata]|nr:hypothetical protein B0H11DRAFT_2273749 [Mycena galericulata]